MERIVEVKFFRELTYFNGVRIMKGHKNCAIKNVYENRSRGKLLNF